MIATGTTLAALLLACIFGWLRYDRRRGYPWLQVCAAMVCGYLLFNKVHSPQYTLWLLPFFVMLAVPFSAVGAVWLFHLLHYNVSIAAWVGMIALLGLDAETGVFMLLFLDLSYEEAKACGKLSTPAELDEAILHGDAHDVEAVGFAREAAGAGHRRRRDDCGRQGARHSAGLTGGTVHDTADGIAVVDVRGRR